MKRTIFLFVIAILMTSTPLFGTIPEGLVLYMSFEEFPPLDHSPDPTEVVVHGTLKHVQGKIGMAVEFNGDNQNVIEVAHSDKLEGMDALTIEAWVLPVNPAGAEGMSIASKRIANKNADVYNVFIWTGQTVRARINAAGEIQSQTALKDGEWYHVAFVFDPKAGGNDQAKLYINGIMETSAAHPEQKVGTGGAPLWVGELDANRGFAWNGIIDELGIWNRALSEDEIAQAMDGTLKSLAVEPQDKLATIWGKIK